MKPAIPTDLLTIEPGRIYPLTASLKALFGWTGWKCCMWKKAGKIKATADGRGILGAEILRLAGPGVELLKPVLLTRTQQRAQFAADKAAARAAL